MVSSGGLTCRWCHVNIIGSKEVIDALSVEISPGLTLCLKYDSCGKVMATTEFPLIENLPLEVYPVIVSPGIGYKWLP